MFSLTLFKGVERKRETSGFGSQPPSKRSRIGSPAEAVGGTSLEVDPVDLVPNVLQALDTLNSDKLVSTVLYICHSKIVKSGKAHFPSIVVSGTVFSIWFIFL